MYCCSGKQPNNEDEYVPPPEPPRDYKSEVGKVSHNREDRRRARDIIQEDIMVHTCWCCYYYFAGCGVMAPWKDGCCHNIGECCCCAGSCKSATPCDEDGCVACTNKCCCSLTHFECPPSNTPGWGLCGIHCCGNLNREDADGLGPREQEELRMLQTTCWLWSCYCCMYGCNSPGGNDPCCKQEGKVCCLWTNTETGGCCEDGCFEVTNKCCCCVIDGSLPAGKTPGCGCCGLLTGGNLNDENAGEMNMGNAAAEMRQMRNMYAYKQAAMG